MLDADGRPALWYGRDGVLEWVVVVWVCVSAGRRWLAWDLVEVFVVEWVDVGGGSAWVGVGAWRAWV